MKKKNVRRAVVLVALTMGLMSLSARFAKAQDTRIEVGKKSLEGFDIVAKPTVPVKLTQPYHLDLADKLLWVTAFTDIASTEYALARGGYEGNPLVRNRTVRIAYTLGSTYLASKITDKLAKNGRPKLAAGIRWSIVCLKAFATGNNVVVFSF